MYQRGHAEADTYVTQGRKQICFTIVISSNHSLEMILVFLWHIFYYSSFKEEEIGTQRSADWSSFSTEMLGFKSSCICFQSLGTKLGSKYQRETCYTPDWIKVCLSHNFYISPLRAIIDCMAQKDPGQWHKCWLHVGITWHLTNADARAPLLINWAESLGWDLSCGVFRKLLGDSNRYCFRRSQL